MDSLEDQETAKHKASASQVDQFQTCARRWGFRYISGLKTPPHPSAAFGTELHAIAEQYLKNGTVPDRLTQAGLLFTQGLPFLPPPFSGGVEGGITLKIDGVEYIGFVDRRGDQVPGWPPSARVVLDHKTSVDPKKYGIWGKEAFCANPQAILYATHDLILSGDDHVNLRWLYYWTKGRPRAAPSDAVLSRAEVEDLFEPVVHDTAKEIVRLKILSPDPLELDPNPLSCKLYGKEGCPYKSLCTDIGKPQIVSAGLRAAFSDTPTPKEKNPMDSDILARLQARRAGTTPSHAPVVPADKINPPEAASTPPPAAVAVAAEAKAVPTPAKAVAKAVVKPKAPEKTAPPAEPAEPVEPSPAAFGGFESRNVVKIMLDELGEALKRTSARI